MWGITPSGRTLAHPNAKASCPTCNGDLIAKCGELKSWHWAHKTKDCDHWSEPESEWHRQWKERFPAEWQEQQIGNHRADVLTPRGIIEFQRSPIKPAEIRERESFYGKMAWVLDASSFCLEDWVTRQEYAALYKLLNLGRPPFNLFDLMKLSQEEKHADEMKRRQIEAAWWAARRAMPRQKYFWLWPRKAWLQSSKKVFLDVGSDHLLRIDRHTRAHDGERWKTVIYCQKISVGSFVSFCSTPAPQPLTNA
jgi:hypothetical protein